MKNKYRMYSLMMVVNSIEIREDGAKIMFRGEGVDDFWLQVPITSIAPDFPLPRVGDRYFMQLKEGQFMQLKEEQ